MYPPLTLIIQQELVELESTWLFAHEAVHMLRAELVNSDGILHRFHTRLETEWNLGVTHRMPALHRDMEKHGKMRWLFSRQQTQGGISGCK